MQYNPSLLINKCFVRKSSHGLKCQSLTRIWKFLVLFKRSQVVPSFEVSSLPSLIILLSGSDNETLPRAVLLQLSPEKEEFPKH